MKIEKVNEHQIRCTLTKEDLASRKLKISELAYGTQKAKELFRDMMEKASDQYGFDAENIPLMIEAIPVNSECIVLVITKVEDPEELDTRFSKFAPGLNAKDDDDDETVPTKDGFTSISEIFNKFKEAYSQTEEKPDVEKYAEYHNGKAFIFYSITDLGSVCKTIYSYYSGKSSVYLNKEKNEYLLILSRENMDAADFIQVSNLISEYSNESTNGLVTGAYLTEHFEPVVLDNAVEILKDLG